MSTLQSSVAEDLLRQLTYGSLRKGTKLPSERWLADRYGVSRNVVREVLSGLAERKLITIEPGRGAFASAPSPSDAAFTMERASLDRGATPADLIEARRVLESQAAALAAERATPAAIAHLRELASAIDTPHVLDRVQFDLALHLGIANASHSVVVEALLVSIAPMSAQLMLRSLSDVDVSREGLPHHADLLDAIEQHDAAAARRAIEEHLAIAERAYGSDYHRPLDDLARETVERMGALATPADISARINDLVARALAIAPAGAPKPGVGFGGR